MMGTVYLVGVGPGDPGLLTLRAAELLTSCEVVVHSGDAPPAVLARVAGRVELAPDDTGALVEMLIELAGKHSRIARVIAGDPLLFAGSAVEAAGLRRAGVPFEFVPGIGLAPAVATSAGMITSGHAGSRHVTVTDAAGLREPEALRAALDLVLAGGTLMVEGTAGELAGVARGLVGVGCPVHLAATWIDGGSTPAQRATWGAVGRIAAEPPVIAEEGDRCVLVVGESAAMGGQRSGGQRHPLQGMMVVVTRPREQASGLVRGLEGLGAEVLAMPTIRIDDPSDPEPLRRAVEAVGGFDWIVFTSVNGVRRFWRALRAAGRDARALEGVSICAVGPATAGAVEQEGGEVAIVPAEYVAEGVIEAMTAATDLRGRRILLPRAEVAREILPARLAEVGAEVHDVPAYRTLPHAGASDRLAEVVSSGAVDLVTFTSGSAARSFASLVGSDAASVAVASIGPVTSAVAKELGMRVVVEASVHTTEGLLRAIGEYYGREEVG